MEGLKISKYLMVAMVLIGLSVIFLIIHPYLSAILAGLIIAYIFYPVYRKVNKHIKNDTVSSFLLIGLILAMVLIPLLIIVKSILQQSLDFYSNFDYEYFIGLISSYLSPEIGFYAKNIFDELLLFIAKSTSNFVLSIPSKVISVFIMLFVLFYAFKEGNKVKGIAKRYLPFKEKGNEELIQGFERIMKGITYGVIVTAFVQGFVGTIGLVIFKVSDPLLWGLVMTFFAMVPLLGAGVVWFPAALYKIYTGDLFNGIGLLLFGVLIVSTIDNIIRPKLIGKKSRVHPVIILLGIFGGLKLFGVIGVILGPFLLASIILFFKFYIERC